MDSGMLRFQSIELIESPVVREYEQIIFKIGVSVKIIALV